MKHHGNKTDSVVVSADTSQEKWESSSCEINSAHEVQGPST